MFIVNADNTIYLTRGDIANMVVSATLQDSTNYTFKPGDIIRFKVCGRKDYSTVYIQKDVEVSENSENVTIKLSKTDTKLGEIINKPIDYWYEIELNPDTEPQTIIGHDDTGGKIFRLFPEGGDFK